MAIDGDLDTAVRTWMQADPDADTKAELEHLLAAAHIGDLSAETQLRDAFSGRLTFGTAGLRAPLGAGPARMNRVVVSQTSAGFAAFLLERAAQGWCTSPPSVVIGFDGRVNSKVFATDAAEVLAGAGMRVSLFECETPTPLTAFAVRHLQASAGVMITASHNPPGDNGYKVYLGDADAGSQIAPPIDTEIAAHIDRAARHALSSLPRSGNYSRIGAEVQDAYVSAAAGSLLAGLPRDPKHPQRVLANQVSLRIAYTALHGVGAKVSRRLFGAAGLPEITAVAEQNEPNGHFPTVEFPNPEEPGALDLVFRTAREIDAELVVAHDPDADRLAIALPDPDTEAGYRRLSGNELGLLLGWRAAEREARRAWSAGETPRGSLANTIVSSPALGAVARHYGLVHHETLSGFKWVSRVPGLLFGFEEALGYLTHPEVVRDKDGILASADAIAMVRECKLAGKSVWQLLDEASMLFGHFASRQIVVRLSRQDHVAGLCDWVRSNPPRAFGGKQIARSRDLLHPGAAEVPANVLAFDFSDGSRVMIRPSGTEPKLKVYIDSCANEGSLEERRTKAERAVAAIEADVLSYLGGAGV